LADAMIHNGLDLPSVRHHYAQALIDQEMPTAALCILDGLIAGAPGNIERNAMTYGLIGRAYKQLYLSVGADVARRKDYLHRTIAAYHGVYAVADTHRWHGINAVALMRRAVRDGFELAEFADPEAHATSIAERILAAVNADPDPGRWECATALEACVALNRIDQAQYWLGRYVNSEDTDAFELASTLRQLVEVWQLDDTTEPGARLLPGLRATLLRREGGHVEIPESHLQRSILATVDDSGLERLFGAAGFHTLTWFRDALERCRLVARIEDSYGDGVGTGFLIDGPSLHGSLPGAVLLTNAHVIPDAIEPSEAFVTFRGGETVDGAAERHRIDTLVWSSPRDKLDVSIATLRTVPTQATKCPLVASLPSVDARPAPRVFIIGHPRGRMQPMFSIQDNLMLDHDATRVHYVAATEPGSSGSPAFDDNWNLVAVHHSGSDEMPRLHGGGTYQANEGIWIGAVREAIGRDLRDRSDR
jgi:hypothetical protein